MKADASGNFRAMVPEGNYVVEADGFEKHITLLPGATYKLDPTLDFVVSSKTGKDGQVTIELSAGGKGTHEFAIRTETSPCKTRCMSGWGSARAMPKCWKRPCSRTLSWRKEDSRLTGN